MADDTPKSEDHLLSEDERPDWLPPVADEYEPRPAQNEIITAETDEYPLRVIAGAGTGKTFTMIRTIENLIADKDVSPDDILAVTFTNKAADSMQEKLHAELGAEGYDVDAYTYHSICHRILSEYAYHAGLDPSFEIATEADQYLLVLETLDDIEYRFVKPDIVEFSAWSSGIVQQLLSYIAAMKRSGIQPEELDAYLGSPTQLSALSSLPDQIRAAADTHLRNSSAESLPENLDEMAAELHRLREESTQNQDGVGNDTAGVQQTVSAMFAAMEETCETLTETFQRYGDDIGSGELEFAPKLPAFLFGSYNGPPKGIPDIGFTFPEKLEAYIETCHTARDLTNGYEAYERQLAANELIDFDDAIIKTVELLSDETLGDEINQQWDYVFCDEFQDTDSLQFELIEQLVPDGNLFVVGDDDQAIYGWRGAKVDNIKGQLEATFGDRLTDKHLQENFRSRQPILDLANTALESLDKRVVEKTLTRFDEPDYDGDSVVTITAADNDEKAALQIRNAITHLLNGEADVIDTQYDPGDIAILTRKHKHSTPIVEALDDAGIPYDRVGGETPDSPGVKTVIAFLKALARPYEDDVSWNRVLLMRYRLHNDDLRRLNIREGPLLDALLTADLDQFEQPGRIEEARMQIESLLKARDRYSVSRLYRELKEKTNIEWYLSEQERRNLKRLERFITSFGDESVQPTLDAEFIEILEQHDDIVDQGMEDPAEQPDVADDAVNVMTIFKSKGLDFPVVIIPSLVADEWDPSERTYDALNSAVSNGPEAVLNEDFSKRDERETRRVLHVGLTRAEDLLLLSGQPSTSNGESADNIPLEFVNESLPASIPWTVGDVSFPVWRELQESCPPGTADWTNTLAEAPSGNFEPDITYDGAELSVSQARERVLALAQHMLNEQLESPADRVPIQVDTLATPRSVEAAIRHSYTSLDTFSECERKHYLDYVVDAFPDRESNWNDTDEVSQREIGVLFHETAEQAAERNFTTKEEWYDECEKLATQHGFTDATSAAKMCIDRYFDCEASDWDVLSAERKFTLEIGDSPVTGMIDAIARKPDGEIVVIDYKATQNERSLEENLQLPLYVIALNEILDEQITTAGYVYVGDVTPQIQLRSFEHDELNALQQQLHEHIQEVEDASYTDYSAGSHCQWCPHNSLSCSADIDLD